MSFELTPVYLQSFKKIYRLILFRDDFKIEIHLLKEYIESYHFPHFEVD